MEPTPSPRVTSPEPSSLVEALLHLPNDKRLINLILHGKLDRSKGLWELAKRLGELAVKPEIAKAVLIHADSTWGKFFDRADSEVRLDELIEAASSEEHAVAKVVPVSPSELAKISVEVEWLIEDLLADQTYGLFTGSTGVGKTQLIIQLGLSLAKGVPWLGYKTKKSRVLHSSLEMGANELQYFNAKLMSGFTLEESSEIYHYLPVGQPISLLTDEGRDAYLQYVEDYDVFIFDTVSSSTHLSMLDESSAPGIVAFFTKLAQDYGKTVIAIAHDSKAKQTDNRAENVYGHRLLIDRASMICRVEKAPTGLILSWPKVRLAKEPESMVYERDVETLWLSSSGKIQQAEVAIKKGPVDDLFG